jgi:carboxypeptidase Taq
MTHTVHPVYKELEKTMYTVVDIGNTLALMGWDQETYMPDGAVNARAEQIATLESLVHGIFTSDETQNLVEKVTENMEALTPQQQRVAKVFIDDQKQKSTLPESFVREQAKAIALGQSAWKKARSEADFSCFQPHLETLVELSKRQAEYYGYEENRYDALMSIYEKGMTTSQVKPVFECLRAGTVTALEKVSAQKAPDDAFLKGSFPHDKQMALSKEIVEKLGFDFIHGRMDLTAHPFCTSFSQKDVRLTTRVETNDLRMCLFSTIHEAGHGMYEQGIDEALYRTVAEDGTSMGIHESQSLFWEDIISRGREFWNWVMPRVAQEFPEPFAQLSGDDVYRAVNVMQPSPIRIEADELTYNLHIILRFEIEEMLINEKIAVKDILELWNEKMRQSLGITPKDDAQGCLQDVHWAFGGIGYFPSYTLGKLIATMLWTTMKEELPNIQDTIAKGEFSVLRKWMRTHIHAVGKTETSAEILTRVCKRELTETDFLKYINAKIDDVYGL